MASTVYTYSLTGLSVFPVNFEYLARRFVVVTLIGTAGRRVLNLTSDYKFTSKKEITTSVVWGPSQGYSTIEIRRFTSATDKLVNFTDGSILRSYDLNISQVQAIHIAEEGRDASGIALQHDYTKWDALGMPITNLGEPTNGTDAATVNYVNEARDRVTERALRAPVGETVRDLPSAIARANKVLSFDASGQPVAIVPASGSAAELAIAIADPNDPTKGAGMSGYKGRTVYDKLSDVLCILDAPFNAKPDGTPQEAAFEMFHEYLATNGGVGWYGPHPLNAGTHRFKRVIGVQAFKSFTVYGDSTLITLENIDPIYTPGAGQKGLANEPHLFDLRGNSKAKIPHPTVTFRDFRIDYSAQRFKGGASELTPQLTDIDPMALGMKLFYSEYGRVIIEGVEGNEVYGEFVQLNRSPWSIIRDNVANNVSAGNIGRNDSTGAFALILRGSSTGTTITGNRAINKRVYQTDTIRGFTDISAKGTPCGYMGIGLEYGNDVGDPAVDYELWLNAGKPHPESLIGDVSNNTMSGYYMGYKAESNVNVAMSKNISFNCWLPYVISTRCRGVVRDNYADRGPLDDLVQPMGGYRYIQGMFCHLSYSAGTDDTPDVVFDGNSCVARSIPVFSTNCNNSKFLNQMTILKGGHLVVTNANRPLTGLELSGSVTVDSLTTSRTNNITDFIDAKVDLKIINKTDLAYILQFNTSYAEEGTSRPSVRLVTRGIVGANFLNTTPSPFKGDFTLTDVTKSFPSANASYNRFFSMDGAYGCKVDLTVRMHSAAVPLGWPVVAYAGGGSVETDLFISDGGSSKVLQCVRVGGARGYSAPTLRIRKHSDPYNSPLVSHFTRFSRSLRIEEAHGNGPLFSGSSNFGPIFLPDFYTASRLSDTGTSEPNSYANLRRCTTGDGDAYYVQGAKFPYARLSGSGKEGLGCVATGRLASEWASSTAVVLNEYKQVKAAAKVYRCTVAGTTGTVAPSHSTGTDVDGGVTWEYIGPMAKFAEYGSFGPEL